MHMHNHVKTHPRATRAWLMLVLLGIAALLVLAACGSSDDDEESDTATRSASPAGPDAHALLDSAATQLQAATTFSLIMDVDGYPVVIEADGLGLPEDTPLTFTYAEGSFQAPDRMQADIDIALGGVGTTLQLIAIDRDHYLSGAILTGGRWLQAELIPGFTPAALAAEDTGIAHAISTVSDLAYIDETTLDGVDVHHLRGSVPAQAVSSLTFGLIRSEEGALGIDIYIRQDDEQLEQIVLTEPAPTADDEATTWTITFFDFNADAISIDAPTL